MTLIAQEAGLNKSTISRSLSNCRIRLDSGIFPAEHFLARPLSDDTPDRTRDQVLQRLRLLIETENPRSPMSDEVLARQLGKARLSISRRTVAKYRQFLQIPGAYERKRNT